MLPDGDQVTSRQHRRCIIPQSSAPEVGRNYRRKHVELIEIINKIIIVASSLLFILMIEEVETRSGV